MTSSAMPATKPSHAPRKFGRAAFARTDLEDAARRYPACDLSPYAAAHGLEVMPAGRLPAGFDGVLPIWPEYVFGCMRGELHGEYVTLMHELYEVGVSSDGLEMGGAFHGVRSAARWSWLGLWENGPKNEPFATNAVWVPTTRGAARVPEAALVDSLVIRRSDRLPFFGSKNLAGYGLPGFRAVGECDDDLLGRLAAGEAGEVLRYAEHPFVEVVVDSGHVSLVRNGYAAPHELDRFGHQLAALSRGVREACLAGATPAPFDTALPAPPWIDPRWTSSDRLDVLQEPWRDAFRRVATEHHMELEDPVAFHRALPGQPVPGRAQGVMRGRVDGIPGTARLGWFYGRARPLNGRVRGALLFSAGRGVKDTPGVVQDRELGVQARITGGIGAVWATRYSEGGLHTRDLMGVGPEAVRRLHLL
jgi:hypothetical protein